MKSFYKSPIVYAVILFIYAGWWGLILFACFPESSLPIAANLDFYKKFDKIFYQRWGFFAPPPTENERLYYIFSKNSNPEHTLSFEVFENMIKEKNEKYLLNDDLANLDYIIHNTISPIEDMLREGYEIYKFEKNCPEKGDTCNYKNYMNRVRGKINETPFMKTLLKHASSIKNKHSLSEYDRIQVVLTFVDLPKYAQRFSKKEPRELPIFKSDLYNYNSKTWEKYVD